MEAQGKPTEWSYELPAEEGWYWWQACPKSSVSIVFLLNDSESKEWIWNDIDGIPSMLSLYSIHPDVYYCGYPTQWFEPGRWMKLQIQPGNDPWRQEFDEGFDNCN